VNAKGTATAPISGIGANVWAALLIIATFGAGTVAPGLLSDYAEQIGFRLMLYIALAESWNLLAGYCGLVSLGSASFIGLGAYVFVGMINGFAAPISLAWIAAGFAGGLLAAAISPAVFRLRGLYFTVGTLALSEALRLLMINVPWFGGATGLFLQSDFPSSQQLYLFVLGLLAITECVLSIVTHSRLSILLRAVRDDEDAAAQIGVRTFRVKLGVFMLGSVLMSAAGALQAYKLGAIEPYGMFGLQWSIDVLAMVIIGGMGLRWGPIIGAVFVVMLGEFLADYPELHVAITGIILIVVIRFAPRGIAGLVSDLARSIGKRVAQGQPA
jgi:branched-chain amino acid transport system permease protein